MPSRWLICFFAAGVLTSCDSTTLLESIADPQKISVAEAYVAQLRSGDHEALIQNLNPQVRHGNEREVFARMASAFPPSSIAGKRELAGYHVIFRSNNQSSCDISFQYEFPDRWVLVNLVFLEQGTERTLHAFHVQPLEQSLRETHRFTLAGRSPVHYLLLAGAVMVPLFCLATAVAVVRTPMRRRKWLWMLAVLFGVSSVSINWTTGAVQFSLLSVHLLGASAFSAGPHAPWILGISLPAGAIAFWIWKRRRSIAAG